VPGPAPKTLAARLRAALGACAAEAACDPPLDSLICPPGDAASATAQLRAAAGRLAQCVDPAARPRPQFVPPEPEFQPAAEGWFLDLLRAEGVPDLLLARQVQGSGALRLATSHSGFLVRAEGAAPRLGGTPVLGPSPDLAGGPLSGHRLLPLAALPPGGPSAAVLLTALRRLAGVRLDLWRLYREPAAVRPAAAWRARGPARSRAEEAPYLERLVAALRLLGPVDGLRGLRLHDPACHDGAAVEGLLRALPGLVASYSDLDPHWPAQTALRLHAAGLAGQALPASNAAVAEGLAEHSVDLVLLRAGNRGVMDFATALAALRRARALLRPGGVIALWGYSFPLLCGDHATALGLRCLLRSTRLAGGPLHTRGVVPFYLLCEDPVRGSGALAASAADAPAGGR